MYFHTDDHAMIAWLAGVFRQAAEANNKVRIDVTSDGCLKLKVGEGIWTPPFSSTPDSHRDKSK